MTICFRMKLPVFVIVFCILGICKSDDCYCEPGFIARMDSNDVFFCFGMLKKIMLPCNTLQEEPCKCTGASGILINHQGSWCANYTNGQQKRKWRCENRKYYDPDDYWVLHQKILIKICSTLYSTLSVNSILKNKLYCLFLFCYCPFFSFWNLLNEVELFIILINLNKCAS